MFCPVCGDEYREGFTRCADCEVPLVEGPLPARMRRHHEDDGGAEDDDDPHRLVPVLTSADRFVLAAALGRLDAMRLPHSDLELRRRGLSNEDTLPEPVQILVARGLREEAERCLVGVEESVAASNRDMERHGFPAGDEVIPPAEIRYCPRCGEMHHGFSRCVDCGVPLVSDPPERAEARRVPLFSTLDVEELAAVRRRLVEAGIPFEWGRLTWGAAGGPEEPRPSPLIPAGWVYVTAARLREAREALGDLPGLAVATADGEDAAATSTAAGEEELGEPADFEEGDEDDEDDDGDRDRAGGEEGTLYCPRCRGEYRAGFSRCADCGVALVERLPATARRRTRAAHDPDEARCESCGAPLPSATAVCPRCSPPDEDEEAAPDDLGDAGDPGDAGARMGPPAAIAAPTGRAASTSADTWWALSTGLPNARADHRRIQQLYRSARFTAWCGLIVLPWITQPVAFRQASQALALVRSYGAGEHPLEHRIERLRWFAFAYGAAAWLALAAWLVERRPF
jgi:hypothetical protein